MIDEPPGRARPGKLLLWAGAGVLLIASAIAHFTLAAHLPKIYWDLEDLSVYRLGGKQALSDGALYTKAFPKALPFLYPPFAALLFAVVAHVSFAVLKWLMTGASLFGLVLSVWLALGMAGVRRRGNRVAATMAVVALALWLDPVSQTLSFGQINILLMLLVLVDFRLADRFGAKGALTGIAAGIKLTPLVFSGYLLFTRRYRAFAVSVAILIVTIGLSFAVLPNQTNQYYIDGKINSTTHLGTGFGANQSLYGMIQRLTHRGADMHTIWMAAAVVTAVCGLLLAAWAHRRGDELLGVCAAAVTGLLISPVSWNHHWVWVVPMFIWTAVRLPRELSRRWRPLAWLLAAAILVAFADIPKHATNVPGNHAQDVLAHVTGWIWLMPMQGNAGYYWSGSQIFVGNLFIFTGIAFLLAVTAYLATRSPVNMRALALTKRDHDPRLGGAPPTNVGHHSEQSRGAIRQKSPTLTGGRASGVRGRGTGRWRLPGGRSGRRR
jgi:alpha-1,2-mannosyltransferase